MDSIDTPQKWTLLYPAKYKVDVHVTSEGAEVEVVARKGKPELKDAGYWIDDGETKIFPMLKYEFLYARGGKRFSTKPTLTLDIVDKRG